MILGALMFARFSAAKIGFVSAIALLISGCFSSKEDDLYEIFRCAKAATMLEREDDADFAMRRAIPLFIEIEKTGVSPSHFAMMMGQRFQDDLELYKYSAANQVVILYEVYNSRSCVNIFKRD